MGNQRRSHRSRSRQLASEREDLLSGGLSSQKSQKRRGKPSQIDEEWQTLNAQIGALENFLSGAAASADRRRRQRLENILPPPDRAELQRTSGHRRMSRWEERHHYSERQRHGITFFLLFCAVCGLLWWLLQASTGM